MCKSHLQENGSYERPENKLLKDIELKKVVKDVVIENVGKVLNKAFKKNSDY